MSRRRKENSKIFYVGKTHVEMNRAACTKKGEQEVKSKEK